MEQQNPPYVSYDPVNTPIMDPERQLEAPDFGAAAVAPLAMLGLGLAGTVAYVLTRRKKPSLQERIAALLEDSRDEAADLAKDAGRFASDTQKEVAPLAEAARKKGLKLFKRGSKMAGKALSTASEVAQDSASAAAAASADLLKHSSNAAGKAADAAYEQAKHFSKHEGRDLAKKASKASQKAAKTANEGRKSILGTYQALEEKYPILTGLLVAALMSEGKKLFESYRTRNA